MADTPKRRPPRPNRIAIVLVVMAASAWLLLLVALVDAAGTGQ